MPLVINELSFIFQYLEQWDASSDMFGSTGDLNGPAIENNLLHSRHW